MMYSRSPLRSLVFLCLAALTLAAATAVLAGDASSRNGPTGNLVTAQWLEQHRGDRDLLLLDASPAPVHAKGHIPGAVNVNVFFYGVRDVPVADQEKVYQGWGLSEGRRVVLYDQGANMMATRGFFALQHHGFPVKDLFILDGGLAKWTELGLPVTVEATPAPTPGKFRIRRTVEDVRARLPEVLAATGDPANHVLLEALGADWHFGETVAFDRPGHIPRGILLPSADFYNADKTFKSPAEIRRMLDYLGVRPEQQIHTYCGGGVAASVPYFALRFLAGYKDVDLYVESEMGWLSDQRELPYWTFDAPYLLRRADWLKPWGGAMMRMYGISTVSVVDVRAPAAYAEGHVPFALSLPAAMFAEHLAAPAGLAAVLGAAGVDPAHEAVVVSGAGLTPDAALAFVLLEKLGQAKVSILLEGAAAWAGEGLAVTKDATIVGARKSPKDQCVPAAVYDAAPRADVVVGAADAPSGVYPRVYVASGAALPAVAPEGKVVHVPYTDLLEADGAPKAAKDIWSRLAKAGVPRYAELVCVADEPGEAAANYVVLKLMGFPDVKVGVR